MLHHKTAALVQLAILNIVLDVLAACHKTLPYSQVGNLIGLQARSGTFHDLLGQTMRADHAAGHLPRCALVVGKADGRPGPAFATLAASLGYTVTTPEQFHDDCLRHFGVI